LRHHTASAFPFDDPDLTALGDPRTDTADLVPSIGLDVPDHAVLADPIADNAKDAVPRLTSLVFAIGWPLDRVQSAVDAGVSVGTLAPWPGGPAGPAVKLSEAEASRREIRLISGGRAKGGHLLFRWLGIDDPDPRVKSCMRLSDKTKVAMESQLKW
jgi:hypothetical protein